MTRERARQHAAAALIFIALSVLMTWPLAPNLTSAVSDPGDPYINTWILDWDWYATFHQPLRLFHANTFHPAKYSLAYSENLYGLAVFLFPLRAAGIGPLTAYNIAMLAGFAFCGFAAYLLALRLTGSWLAAMAAGVFYAFVPFRIVHLAHLQHVWGGWLPLLLLTLLRYAERPTRKRAVAFAAVFVLNGLTNIHYLLFGAFATGITALFLLPREKWRELAFAMAGALLILAPFLYPYAAVAKLYGMQRSYEEVARFSAVARDWLPGQTEAELKLYPGALAYGFAIAALFVIRKYKPQFALALLWIAIGFLGSLGLNFEPHTFLFGAVPGFRAIRVPARWAVIAYVGLAILIALVTAAIARRSRWLAALVPIAFVVNLWPLPLRWYLADPRPREVYTWLAKQNVRGVAELPIDSFGSDYEYMLRATAHHKPIVNGVSGFAPPLRDELSRLWKESPIPDAFIDKLREAHVDTVIIHADALGGHAEPTREWVRRELARGRLSFTGLFHSPILGDWVFRVGPGPNAPGLETFFEYRPTCTSGMMGALDHPAGGAHFQKGAMFSAWAVSRDGVVSADLWFNNRTYRHRAQLIHDEPLNARCPGVPNVGRARFIALFKERPEGVRRITDVQVELIDRKGVKHVLDDRWITWD
jgi:hypothetical protein